MKMDLPDSLIPISESITELVASFLESSRNADAHGHQGTFRQANWMYELDELVSDFLDHHALSTDDFHAIEQQVLNSLAEELMQNDPESFAMEADNQGNFNAESIFSALDQEIAINEASFDAISLTIDFDPADT